MERCEDPTDEFNSSKYHTGKLCVEGCGRPAGTYWSPYWCQACNAKRIVRINHSLQEIQARLQKRKD